MGGGQRQVIHRYKGKETKGKAMEDLKVPKGTFMEHLQ